MNTYCVLFSNGLSGTWLTWFINQHKDFPDRLELDPAHSDPEHPDRITDYSTQPNWWHAEQSWEDFIVYCERQDHPNERENEPDIRWGFSNLAFKVQPYHEFFGPDMNSDQSKEACKFVLDKSNCKQVIVPVCNEVLYKPIYNRLIAIRHYYTVDKDPKKWYNSILYEYIQQELKVPLLYLDIGKILSGNDSEYQTLIQTLKVPELNNWKELVNDCRREIYDNYK
jgi:hypothetical protein